MRLRFTERADKDYAGLPVKVRKAFAKQLHFLLANLHPSLRAQKIRRRARFVAGPRDQGVAILFQD